MGDKTKELTKKAAEMLLKGATLLSEPCPYCNGVRVMKDGNALCISCGSEPDHKKDAGVPAKSKTLQIMEKKLEKLTKELDQEEDHQKQQEILNSINSLLDTIEKLKNKAETDSTK